MFSNCCSLCGQPIKDINSISPAILLSLEKEEVAVDMSQAVWMLEDFFQGKYTHLSMTEIILFRVDILIKALSEYFEDIKFISFSHVFLCEDCNKERQKQYELV